MHKRARHKKFKEGGRNGGKRTLEMHGKKHYEEIGKKGALKRWGKEEVEIAEEAIDESQGGV